MIRRAVGLAALMLGASVKGVFAQTTRDSAGIRIVENASRLKAPIAFTLAEKPKTSFLGGVPADGQFSAYTALQLRDGRVVLGGGITKHVQMPGGSLTSNQVVSPQLKYYSAQGTLESTVSLPAPFKAVFALCEGRADTLVVGDTNGKIVGILDGAGKVVRTIPITGGVRPESCFDDGSFLIMTDSRIDRNDPYGNVTRMVTKRSDGSIIHDFGWLPNMSMAPASPVPSLLVRGSFFYLADSKTSEIRVYTTQGLLARIVRSSDPILPVTGEQLARGEGAPPIASPSGAAIPDYAPGKTWPAYGKTMTDQTGRLWVSDYERSNLISKNWTAFDSTGKMIGRLVIPPDPSNGYLSVMAFGVNEVLIRMYDRTTQEARIGVFPLLPVGKPIPSQARAPAGR